MTITAPRITISDTVQACIGRSITTLPLDNRRVALVLRAARTPWEREEIMHAVLTARAQHRTWLTVTQREWQAKQRHISARTMLIRYKRWGSRHTEEDILRAERESVKARDKYVRCAR